MNSVSTVDVFFDDHAVQVMGKAFDRACVRLADNIGLREELGKKIIEAGKSGERDPIQLCRLALRALGVADHVGEGSSANGLLQHGSAWGPLAA